MLRLGLRLIPSPAQVAVVAQEKHIPLLKVQRTTTKKRTVPVLLTAKDRVKVVRQPIGLLQAEAVVPVEAAIALIVVRQEAAIAVHRAVVAVAVVVDLQGEVQVQDQVVAVVAVANFQA